MTTSTSTTSKPAFRSTIDDQINQLKKTSIAYIQWQAALNLRDRIYGEIGATGTAVDRIKEVIKYWSAQWKEEMSQIDPQPTDTTLEMLGNMEAGISIHKERNHQ